MEGGILFKTLFNGNGDESTGRRNERNETNEKSKWSKSETENKSPKMKAADLISK